MRAPHRADNEAEPRDRPLVVLATGDDATRRELTSELSESFVVAHAPSRERALALLVNVANVRAVLSDRDLELARNGVRLLGDVRKLAPTLLRVLIVPAPLALEDAAEFLRGEVSNRIIVKPWHRGEVLYAIRCALAVR